MGLLAEHAKRKPVRDPDDPGYCPVCKQVPPNGVGLLIGHSCKLNLDGKFLWEWTWEE